MSTASRSRMEGRVGMAALVAEERLDLAGLRKHLAHCLPAYARPVFLRIRTAFDVTGPSSIRKAELIRQGYNPMASADALYFDSLESRHSSSSTKNFTIVFSPEESILAGKLDQLVA